VSGSFSFRSRIEREEWNQDRTSGGRCNGEAVEEKPAGAEGACDQRPRLRPRRAENWRTHHVEH